MSLEDLGYHDTLEKVRIDQHWTNFDIGRVITEHKERYIVQIEKGEVEAEITGNMRYSAKDRSHYPAVGDWVALTVHDAGFALIHKVFPRKSILERQAVGQFGEIQIVATNLDYALITQALDRDFSINRIERYLTICYSGKVEPILVLSKSDLVDEHELELVIFEIKSRIKNILIFPISNQTKHGYGALKEILLKGKTYCLLGSSGVGKSTLINNLIGSDILKTNSISTSNFKGKHTTSHRELNVLENGSILIDNPGMREVGIADTSDGLEVTFDTIIQLSKNCKFADCTHLQEKGCAVLDAIEQGIIDQVFYENYLKMEREKARFQTSVAEKRKRDKAFGKMYKEVQELRKQQKY